MIFNFRYGPWLDTNLVIPTGKFRFDNCYLAFSFPSLFEILCFLGPTTSRVLYHYYLETSFLDQIKDEDSKKKYIAESLKSSEKVQVDHL